MPHLLQERDTEAILLETGGLLLLERNAGLAVGDTASALLSSRMPTVDEIKAASKPGGLAVLSFGPGDDFGDWE